jgi:hypothetical protein
MVWLAAKIDIEPGTKGLERNGLGRRNNGYDTGSGHRDGGHHRKIGRVNYRNTVAPLICDIDMLPVWRHGYSTGVCPNQDSFHHCVASLVSLK